MVSSRNESRMTERQARLVAYWKSKRIDTQWPSRRDINPGDVLDALATVSLVEYVETGFRFRLTGSRLRSIFGGDVQGQLMSEIDATVEEAGRASMSLALETGRPVSGSRQVGDRWHFWLRLPLLDEAGKPQLVLCSDEICDNAMGFVIEHRRARHAYQAKEQVAA